MTGTHCATPPLGTTSHLAFDMMAGAPRLRSSAVMGLRLRMDSERTEAWGAEILMPAAKMDRPGGNGAAIGA